MEQDKMQIEGRNPIWEALKAKKSIEKLFIQKGLDAGRMRELISLAKRNNVLIEYVPKAKLDDITQTYKHQGMIGVLPAVDYSDFDEMIKQAFEKDESPLFVALDEIQDPHNLGAIIRSAECSGAAGVIVTQRRSAPLSAVAYKASAGAVEHIPIARVKNLVDAIEDMKQSGIWVIGTDAQGEAYIKSDLTGPMAFVIGSEGKGMRRLVKEKCDSVVAISMNGKINSLNASVAAGVLLFESVRQRAQEEDI